MSPALPERLIEYSRSQLKRSFPQIPSFSPQRMPDLQRERRADQVLAVHPPQRVPLQGGEGRALPRRLPRLLLHHDHRPRQILVHRTLHLEAGHHVSGKESNMGTKWRCGNSSC